MKKIHFMGIGGSGANAAAGLAHGMGYEVSGCDLKHSVYAHNLERLGIPIQYEHNVDHLSGVDVVCITPALLALKNVPEEFRFAKKNCKVMTWQEFMGGELQKDKDVIAIAGTKGKSTTTTFVGRILELCNFDPIVQVGADVKEWGQNFRIGRGTQFVCEADEFNNNFLNFVPNIAVITSLSFDHPEYFESFEGYIESFVEFVSQMDRDSSLIINIDSEGVRQLLSRIDFFHGKIITFGTSDVADYKIEYYEYDFKTGSSRVDLRYFVAEASYVPGGTMSFENVSRFISIRLPFVGAHNAMNFIPALIIARSYGVELQKILDLSGSLSLPGRRFDYKGSLNGAALYDDYAHSPMSVKVALRGAREAYPDKYLIALCQPHMYSRTLSLLDEYRDAFNDADELILLPIYASREEGSDLKDKVNSQMIADVVKMSNDELKVSCVTSIEEVVSLLKFRLDEGVVLVNLGAGDNYKITDLLLEGNCI
mgnify:CR=1 FL=1